MVEADRCLQEQVENFMKQVFFVVYGMMTLDVDYDDLVRGYKARNIAELKVLIAKTRFYLNYKSPMNKFEWLGSAIHDERHMLTVLWRLSSLAGESIFSKYSPMRMLGRMKTRETAPPKVVEGAVDLYFNANGEVNRMVNRKVIEQDWADVRRTEEFKKKVAEELAAEKAAKAKRFAKYL